MHYIQISRYAPSIYAGVIGRLKSATTVDELGRFTVLVLVANYPFLITSSLVLESTGSYALGLRLILSFIYNIAISSIFIFTLGLLNKRLASIILKLTLAFFGLFTFLSLLHFYKYSQLIGLPSIYAIIDTTWQEAIEYILATTYSANPLHSLIALLSALPLAIALFRHPEIPRWNRLPQRRRRATAIAGLISLIGIGYLGSIRPYLWLNNPIMMVVGSTTDAIIEMREIKRILESTAGSQPTGISVRDHRPATHILIIGESTTSRHMSLYGYGRDTSPELRRLAPDLEIATNACSSRGNTAEQMKELLTFATREDSSLLTKGPSLTQLLRAGGFKVSWLSNQQIAGEWDRWAGIFSRDSDVRQIVNLRGWTEGVSYDEKLLPPLRDALNDGQAQRLFIIVHLLGAHHGYDLRYPPEFQKFEGSSGADERFTARNYNTWKVRLYNNYDNALLYNDFIVSEIIREAKKIDRATVTYLSDHGEALGETSNLFGHMEGPGPRQIYEIPLLFYMSPTFRKEHAGELQALRSNLRKPIQSDQLIHTLLHLYGISHPLRRSEESLLSTGFRPKHRYCDTLAP